MRAVVMGLMTDCSLLWHFEFRTMKRNLVFLCVVFFITTSGVHAGTKEDVAQLQRNVIEIQQQFWDLEKRLSNTDSFAAGLKDVQDSTQQLREAQASLNAKLERLLNEIETLNEKVEETN